MQFHFRMEHEILHNNKIKIDWKILGMKAKKKYDWYGDHLELKNGHNFHPLVKQLINICLFTNIHNQLELKFSVS